jgi:hypothetical protein
MMFKAQMIQNLYGLGNEQLECQIEDRRGFQRYPRLAWQSCAAHQKTISTLRTGRPERILMASRTSINPWLSILPSRRMMRSALTLPNHPLEPALKVVLIERAMTPSILYAWSLVNP